MHVALRGVGVGEQAIEDVADLLDGGRVDHRSIDAQVALLVVEAAFRRGDEPGRVTRREPRSLRARRNRCVSHLDPPPPVRMGPAR